MLREMRRGTWVCCERWPRAEGSDGLGLSRRPPAAAGIETRNCVLPQYLVTLKAGQR